MRRFVIASVIFLTLAGCGRGGNADYAPNDLRAEVVAGDNTAFSFSHWVSVEMGDAAIRPRFDRTKARCLTDKALHCRLLDASFRSWQREGGTTSSTASLTLALPHDQIARFEDAILRPVSGENPGDATVTSRSTRSENVSDNAQDNARKLAQLADYRDRLAALTKRPGIAIDDVIKLDAELSKTEGQIADLEAQKAALERQIGEEQLTISLAARSDTSLFGPARRVWGRSLGILADSVGNALEFAINLIPWLPLIVGAFFLFTWLWRVVRRRSAVANSPRTKSDHGG